LRRDRLTGGSRQKPNPAGRQAPGTGDHRATRITTVAGTNYLCVAGGPWEGFPQPLSNGPSLTTPRVLKVLDLFASGTLLLFELSLPGERDRSTKISILFCGRPGFLYPSHAVGSSKMAGPSAHSRAPVLYALWCIFCIGRLSRHEPVLGFWPWSFGPAAQLLPCCRNLMFSSAEARPPTAPAAATPDTLTNSTNENKRG